MAGELRPFIPELLTLNWAQPGGTIDLTQGLIDGPGAIVEAIDNPHWTQRGDRQGNYARSRRRARGGTLTLTYVAEAEIQDVLSTLANSDYLTATVVGACVMKDLNGTTLMRYDSFYIQNIPAASFGDTAADRPWVFGFAQRVPFLGGAAVAA